MTWQEMTERERDVWLAEKVMGWKFSKPTHGSCCTCQRCGRPNDECANETCEISTDLAAAMGLAEQMREKGWDYGIEYGWYEKSYRAYFREHDSGMERFREGYARAATVAPALAEACYRALGGE